MNNKAIGAALSTQKDGNSDNGPPPDRKTVFAYAKKHFGVLMKSAWDVFMAQNESVIPAVVGKVSISALQLPAKEIAKKFFGGHVLESNDEPRGHLGPQAMSFVLQANHSPEFASPSRPVPDPPESTSSSTGPPEPTSSSMGPPKRKLPKAPNTKGIIKVKSPVKKTVKMVAQSFSKVSASVPVGWPRKSLTIGKTGVGGSKTDIADEFEDPSGLKLILLLNRLVRGVSWINAVWTRLSSINFHLAHRHNEKEAENLFADIEEIAIGLVEVLKPILNTSIGAHTVDGGRTDISLAATGKDEEHKDMCNYMAIIEFKKPFLAYRAANILAFGDAPTTDDYIALGQTIGSSKPMDAELHLSAKLLRRLSKYPLKYTMQQVEGRTVHGYTCNGEDITEQLKASCLKEPLDALHVALVQAARYASLNECKYMAVSDGFTLIAVRLVSLEEHEPGLITANFDCHYALDLMESGSSLKLLQFFINAYFRDKRALKIAMTLLSAAVEEKGEGEITPENSATLNELVQRLKNYRFHSSVYSQNEGLAASGQLFLPRHLR